MGSRQLGLRVDGVAVRYEFIDQARGLAFIWMLVNHVWTYLVASDAGLLRVHVAYVTVTLAAPLFLFVAGASIAFSWQRWGGSPFGYIRKQTIRGLVLCVLGFILVAILKPEKPAFYWGVLQTIGLWAVILGPITVVTSQGRRPIILLFISLALYISFALSVPWINAGPASHPILGRTVFGGFSPWPWGSAIIAGLAAGQLWVLRMKAGKGLRKPMEITGLCGLVLVSWYALLSFQAGKLTDLVHWRDFLVNYHWVPDQVTMLWVIGAICLSISALFYLSETWGIRSEWLNLIGRHALLSYVAHLILIRVVGERLLGIELSGTVGALGLVLVIFIVMCLLAWLAENIRSWKNISQK